jgi:hypothetical protein
MISLHIEAENETQFAQQLTAVAALLNAQLNTVTVAVPAKETKRGKTSSGPAETGATTPAATASGASAQSATSGAQIDPTGDAAAAAGDATSASTTAASADVTRESVAKKCTIYGQPSKGGPAALKELFIEFGSENGKWSEVADDKLPELNARLDDLLG